MSDNRLSSENMLSSLPKVLQKDGKLAALASSVACILNRKNEIQRLAIYSQIDVLPEDLINILIHDFKVDWCDDSYTLEEKRRTLKESWRVHSHLGTAGAVRVAISAIYSDTLVSEWWQYGGEPYHFKLLINATYEKVDPQKHQRVIDNVNYYKNLRSTLDEVEYYDSGPSVIQYAGATCIGCNLVDGATAVQY